MQFISSVTTQVTGWFGEAVVSTAAGLLIALMMLPLMLFVGSCWFDQRFVESRRPGTPPQDRHQSRRQQRALA